jgi:hypothetical protein
MPADEQGSQQLLRQDAEALRGPAFGEWEVSVGSTRGPRFHAMQ